MKVLHTFGGSEVIFVTDRHGNKCTLLQSKVGDYEPPKSSAIWLGAGENLMYISHEQLKALMPHLQQWIKTGSFHLTGSAQCPEKSEHCDTQDSLPGLTGNPA
ncbi:hypothetical protein [Desulfosudis oleivorans]|uniref:hypothetical protein n=1 Tax=Desulfosudis oleivorans TaxID=181663 RepID=UPI0012947168|nr:hypothetical protein [Desulfosudis oleivorans]